ncbi:MAG: hypothetical protein IPK07_07235 [Deltaproteobacteria bacterium]|nr:hypothetical protein [Deltaproteobacteria bacterium]
MPIASDGRAWAAVRINNIRLPTELPTAVGPDAKVPWLRDVALDPLVEAIVAAIWKHRAWRAAELAAAALALVALIRLAVVRPPRRATSEPCAPSLHERASLGSFG